MRYGAMNFPVNPILAEIDTIAQLGMDYLELTMDPPQAHYNQIYNQSKTIKKRLRQLGLGLVCHMPTFVYTADLTESIRNASLQEVIRSMEAAADMEAEKVVLHPGATSGLAFLVPDLAHSLAMDSLGQIWQRAEQLGITICLENMFAKISLFVKPQDFEPVFRAFPAMQFILDIGHAYIGDKSGQRIIDFIMRFSNRLGHVHASDNCGQHDDHVCVGYGQINFKAIARALKQVGYDNTITLEIFDKDRTEIVKSRQKISRMLAHTD